MDIQISWGAETIAYDKSLQRNEKSLYPDSVLWGVAINGICNPTVKTMLEEIAKELNDRSQAGAILGKSKTEKKSAAARQNGRKGGRPRKTQAPA